MQRHLDALHTLAQDSDLSIDLCKTKATVFNAKSQWVTRSTLAFKYGQETMQYVGSYTHLEVLFRGPTFSMKRAAKAMLTRRYAALGGLEKMHSHIQFQRLCTKLLFFMISWLLSPYCMVFKFEGLALIIIVDQGTHMTHDDRCIGH